MTIRGRVESLAQAAACTIVTIGKIRLCAGIPAFPRSRGQSLSDRRVCMDAALQARRSPVFCLSRRLRFVAARSSVFTEGNTLMSIRVTRSAGFGIAAVCILKLLSAPCGTPAAWAQSLTGDSHAVVEVPIGQLTQIQDELRYLRERDAERQAWEESVATRLPSANFSLASGSSDWGEKK